MDGLGNVCGCDLGCGAEGAGCGTRGFGISIDFNTGAGVESSSTSSPGIKLYKSKPCEISDSFFGVGTASQYATRLLTKSDSF